MTRDNRPRAPGQTNQEPDATRGFVHFLYLNLALLGLSAVANLFIDRAAFSLVHVAMFLGVVGLLVATQRSDWAFLKRIYLALLMPYLISFAYLGEQESFDILWMLMFPPIAAFLVLRPASLVRWDAAFLTAVLGVYVLHWTRVAPIGFSDIALGGQFTALFFLAVISWFMQGYKARFDQLQRRFQSDLERAVDDGLGRISALNDELETTQVTLVRLLGELCEARSKETGDHVGRVAAYARHLARLAGLTEDRVTTIHRAAPLHDVGKVAIPDRILNKPARLSDEEFREMQTHTSRGHDILAASGRPLLRAAATIAHEHHERWDGGGYPRGLSGESISVEGRVVAIADVFDALSFERPYKPAWDDERIRDLFAAERGRQFDPTLTDLFLARYDEFLALRQHTVADGP
ncbi:MAG: HD domain-containing protein [Halothiobacillaceae bacterium]|nr:HD domain-containing protein [Halothiobacillaceae bacterium]HER33941.1 HD domain-containing protein [Halothiobacillaceae bacterium]